MITLDFETYSPENLKACGGVKYTMHPEADIVCLGYKIDDYKSELWTCRSGHLPGLAGHKIYAHGAFFDYNAWHNIGCRKYGFPEIPLENWVDSMALGNRYTLPSKLKDSGKVMGLETQKSAGLALIKRICTPDKDGNRPVPSSNDLMDFYEYCLTDVDSTYELIQKLPAIELSEHEQKIWCLTQRMNLRGVPVEIEIVSKILSYIESFAEELTYRVPEITSGQVEKVTQTQRMVKWIQEQGVKMPNLQAITVQNLLDKGNLRNDIKELLELRQTLGRSSTAKYRKIKDMEFNGRVYDNLQYYGANTGRWTGRGFQLHNLPRASVSDPENTIAQFDNFEPVDDPVNVAKALIRPMIKAEVDHQLIVSDYKSIENFLLMWVADEREALELLRQGGDQYKEMAAFMYNKDSSSVTDKERWVGKVVILGAGFGMGGAKFQSTASDQGLILSLSESTYAIDAYRTKYAKVKKLWYRLKNSAVNAIRNPGQRYTKNGVSFRVVKDKVGTLWLCMTLPSGRNLYYMEPYLSDDDFGTTPGHYGTDPYTKKWTRLRIIPGRFTENVMQALARDLMANGLLQVEEHMPEVSLLASVHDEAVGQIHDRDIKADTIHRFNSRLCAVPDWCSDLPLMAEGWIGPRYKKG